MTLNEIQTFLQIPLTETIDEFTEAALRNFQLKCELDVTGQIDQPTIHRIQLWNEGQLDTDYIHRPTIKKHYLQPNEYMAYSGRKRAIFLHHTAGWNNPYAVVNDWERDTRGPIGTAYLIGGVNPVTNDNKFDGEILECMPPTKSYAWHLGIGNTAMHRDSIGIELCHFGWVTKEPTGEFRTYPILDNRGKVLRKGQIVDPSNVIKLSKPFRGYEYYIRYSDQQLINLRYLLMEIGKSTGIDITLGLQKRIKNLKDVWKAFDYDASIVRGQDGLFTHTNVSPANRWGNYEKWDMFPQNELIDMINTL